MLFQAEVSSIGIGLKYGELRQISVFAFACLLATLSACGEGEGGFFQPDSSAIDAGMDAMESRDSRIPMDSLGDVGPPTVDNLLGNDSCDVPDVSRCSAQGNVTVVGNLSSGASLELFASDGVFYAAVSDSAGLRVFQKRAGSAVQSLGTLPSRPTAVSWSASNTGQVSLLWAASDGLRKQIVDLSGSPIDLNSTAAVPSGLSGSVQNLLWQPASQVLLATSCSQGICTLVRGSWPENASSLTLEPLVNNLRTSTRLFASTLLWLSDSNPSQSSFRVGVLENNNWRASNVAEANNQSPIAYGETFDLSFDQATDSIPSAAFVFDTTLLGTTHGVRARLYAATGGGFEIANRDQPDKFLNQDGEDAAGSAVEGFVGGYALSYVTQTSPGIAKTRLAFLRSNLDAVRILEMGELYNTTQFPSQARTWLSVAGGGRIWVLWTRNLAGQLELVEREVVCN